MTGSAVLTLFIDAQLDYCGFTTEFLYNVFFFFLSLSVSAEKSGNMAQAPASSPEVIWRRVKEAEGPAGWTDLIVQRVRCKAFFCRSRRFQSRVWRIKYVESSFFGFFFLHSLIMWRCRHVTGSEIAPLVCFGACSRWFQLLLRLQKGQLL